MLAQKEIIIISQKWCQLEMQVHEWTFSDILGFFQSIYSTNIRQALLKNLHSNISFWSLIWGLKFQGRLHSLTKWTSFRLDIQVQKWTFSDIFGLF